MAAPGHPHAHQRAHHLSDGDGAGRAHLPGQPRLAGISRAAMADRRGRAAGLSRSARRRPRSRPRSRATGVLNRRPAGKGAASGPGVGPDPRHQRVQGHAVVCRPPGLPRVGGHCAGRPDVGPGIDGRPSRPRRLEDDDLVATGQGVLRLEPECRGQDDDLALFIARPTGTVRRCSAHVGRGAGGRGDSRGPGSGHGH